MKLSLIAAVSDDNVIGKNNALPWHLPKDLLFFKKITMGKPIIMGRKTFESLGKPLPGRLNIVISAKNIINLDADVIVLKSIDEVLLLLQERNIPEAFVIGGAKVFEHFYPHIDTMYITKVHGKFSDGDVFFNEIDHTHWRLIWSEHHEKDEKHLYSFTFQEFKRVEM